ncbi:hypothetical protein KM043_017380 [Ampulex compressa]|nr:hypothetical protein KM043_017380 [Ampulex compressa]
MSKTEVQEQPRKERLIGKNENTNSIIEQQRRTKKKRKRLPSNPEIKEVEERKHHPINKKEDIEITVKLGDPGYRRIKMQGQPDEEFSMNRKQYK